MPYCTRLCVWTKSALSVPRIWTILQEIFPRILFQKVLKVNGIRTRGNIDINRYKYRFDLYVGERFEEGEGFREVAGLS